MTDRCTIRLPRNIKMGNTPITKIFKRGMAVTVALGYGATLHNEFKGYVTYVKPTTTIEIVCEDEMYLLKVGSYTKSWSNASLDDILKYVLGTMPYKTFGSLNIGPFSISNCTPAKVLQEIEKVTGFKSFFRTRESDGAPVLIVGMPYDPEVQKMWTYHFNKNVQSNTLEYRTKDQMKIKVKATSMLANGKKLAYETGADDGEVHTLHYYNLPLETLKKRANADYQKLMYDGYRGSIRAWGFPRVNHGDIISLLGSSESLIIGQGVDDWSSDAGILLRAVNTQPNGDTTDRLIGDFSIEEPTNEVNYTALSQNDFINASDDYFQSLLGSKNKYYVDEVVKTFSMSAYKREVKIGAPAADVTDFNGNKTYQA